MPLLCEYALTPDVFKQDSYADAEITDNRFDFFREILLNESGILRNLRDGDWQAVLSDQNCSGKVYYKRTKELLRKMGGRIRPFPPMLDYAPVSDNDWCKEAVASHKVVPLTGIIAADTTASEFLQDTIVVSSSKVTRAPWWGDRSESVRLKRNIDSYLENLSTLFSCSNHIMFIDPYIDPKESNYSEFGRLLRAASNKKPSPLIEIHRTILDNKKNFISIENWKKVFEYELKSYLLSDAQIEVFLWDKIHDRYLITNIAGFLLPHGFDTDSKENSITTWCRLSRKDRDHVMLEHDSNGGFHKLQGRFKL